jgi:hypothetical protein
VLSGLPSNEKIYSTHYNSYNEGPNLALLSFTKSPSNPLPTIEFPKNHITSSFGNVVFHYQIPSICLLVKAYFDVVIAKTLISCIIQLEITTIYN